MLRKLIGCAAAACLVLFAVIGFNVLTLTSRQVSVAPITGTAVRENDVAERLAGAVHFQTISNETPSEESHRALLDLHDYLQKSFPQLHATLQREIINTYSLLYTWKGQDASLPPIVLMAHQDVVPIAPGTEADWHAAPFSGEIKDGFVWGRGSWDDKGNLMAILEATESLIAAGYRPQRTVYLVFGHDEEIDGLEGARQIAALFLKRGIRAEFVLDEGLLIAEGILPGLDPPVALIGIAEKGSATLTLTSTATPGHSSMPGPRTAIGALAVALERLERHPFPASIGGVVGQMFDTVVPEMHGLNRVALANRWILGPLLCLQLSRTPSIDALLRTTTAMTVVRGGAKENVLPGSAQAVVNFRLLPGDTVSAVAAHVREVVDDGGIGIETKPTAAEASPVSSTTAEGYRLIARSVREIFPGVVVAPGLMVGATDSRHLLGVADNVYRFSPVRAHAEDLARFHGTDERISVTNYAEMIRFYETLIGQAAGGINRPH